MAIRMAATWDVPTGGPAEGYGYRLPNVQLSPELVP
jgi:hypothetical protein